jgi:hypothetical protein
LIVDVKTDLLPVGEFVVIRTEVSREPFEPRVEPGRRIDLLVTADQDFLSGVRVADVEGLATGTSYVRVAALGPGGELILDRITLVTVRGRVALTVLLTRSCRGVTCPPDGSPNLSACLGGRCVDPACSPENPAACGTLDCDATRPCVVEGATCVDAVCAGGACLVTPDHSACAADERCDVDRGCVLRDGTMPDAGSCPARETVCTDGADDDCDGDADCADSDCDGVSCAEFGRTCAAGTCGCAGGAMETLCGDAADEDCDGDVDCDDADCAGVACGALGEICGASGCACPGRAPETECGDAIDGDCDGVRDCMDTDCDTLSCGPAGEVCTAGACSCTGGSMEAVCDDGADNDCDASTDCTDADCDGRSCGAQVVGAWGACGGYADACDQSGTQSRSITDPTCSDSGCMPVVSMESRPCTRTVADGTSCGSTWMRCCSGVCRNLATDETHCGACRVDCPGSTVCAATGTGGYACRGCTGNAQCRGELDTNATCYDLASPPAFCQCQCAAGTYTSRVCADGGCGAGFYCHACAGLNWCAPFGGSC